MLREILRVRIGSYCHGTNNEKSDQDIRSICIPPIQMYFGLNSWDENVRKENGNDFEEWNIKKLFNLLVKGNPSAMNILFVNKKDIFNCDQLGLRLLQNKDIFLSKRIINSCVGYAVSQIQKIEIGRGTKEGNRSAIIEEFGYDCYTEDTEFLTVNGWKKYNDITENVKLATVNPVLKTLEYQNYSDRVRKKYSGYIYNVKNRWTDFNVTSNHRIFCSPVRISINKNKYVQKDSVWKFIPLKLLLEGSRSKYHVLTNFSNDNKNYSVAENYLKLLGAFASEGTFGKFRNNKYNCIRISQTNKGKEEFHYLMNSLPKNYGFKKYVYVRNKNLVETIWISHNKKLIKRLFYDCNHLSINKTLPEWINLLSHRQANILLHSLYLGDGSFTKEKGFDYRTKSKALADKVQILALLSGYDCNISYYEKHKQMYRVYYSEYNLDPKSIFFNKRNVFKNEYRGNIVCFSVKNENLITRRNGKIAIQGNTKFMYHAIMMLNMAIELIKHGRYSPLRPEPEQRFLKDIRLGKVTLEEARAVFKSNLETTNVIESMCKLPEKPDEKVVEDLLVDILTEHFNEDRSCNTYLQKN